MPCDEGRIQAQRVVDAEIRQLRPDPRLVDRAVPEMAARKANVRLERRLDELLVRGSPAEPGQDAYVSPLDQAEPAGSPGDLRELPRVKVTTLLAVELRRLGEQERLARQVDSVAEDVRRDADVRCAGDEALDLLTPRGQRHRAVEHGDLARLEAVHLAGECKHRAPAEGDDHASRRQRAKRPRADELERQLALEDLQLMLRKCTLDERECVECAEQEDLAVLAREQESRPRGAALRVVGPLHLVEDEELARVRRHLDRRADDRRALVDSLLTCDQPDVLRSDPLSEPSMCFLREHAQRACVDAGALLCELLERGVRLPRVRRPEVGDDPLGLDTPRRQRDGDGALRLAHGLARVPAGCASRAARPLLPATCRTPVAHSLRRAGSAEA